MSSWRQNRWAYISLVLELVIPGKRPYYLPGEDVAQGDLDGWSDEELILLVDEGRRQFDRQAKNLDGLRTRSQWLFTTGLAVLAVLVGPAHPPDLRWPTLDDLLVFIGLASAVYAVLGAAALLVVPATFGIIDAGDLSRKPTTSGAGQSDQGESILKQLAGEYAAAVRPGEVTWRTRLTVFFEVAVWLLIAAGCAGLIYLRFE